MRLLVWVDKLANVSLGWVLGGGLQPWGWTISDRLWFLRSRGSWVGRTGCSLLNIVDKDHCDEAIEHDGA